MDMFYWHLQFQCRLTWWRLLSPISRKSKPTSVILRGSSTIYTAVQRHYTFIYIITACRTRYPQFVTRDVQNVMRLNALETSHPINVVVHHPNEICEIFDRIFYGKGATILRMLDAFLGKKTFRQGVTNYLKLWQYGNAVQDDLWDALTKQAITDKIPLPASVKDIMDTWTLKMGQFSIINFVWKFKI